jgi:hypothetical protein
MPFNPLIEPEHMPFNPLIEPEHMPFNALIKPTSMKPANSTKIRNIMQEKSKRGEVFPTRNKNRE